MLELPKIRYGAELDSITATDLSTEYPEAVALLKQLRPIQKALTGETRTVKTADGVKQLPIVQFHGMVSAYPSPDDDPADQEYITQSWDLLDVGGKELLPTHKFIFPAANLDRIDPAHGGVFAEWLVKRLVDNKSASQVDLAWQMSPPPLYKEGTKVQTPWLFNFLRNPGRLRHTTVLRMPRFNMSDDDAQALANYFAAVDGTPFPYQLIAEREPAYLSAMNADFHKAFPDKKQDYLQESWQMLNAPLCIKCHSVAGRQVTVSDPKTDIRGPNLELASDRLKPDWTLLWLYRPQWITPYTSMPSPLPPQQEGAQARYPELFGGSGLRQTISLRDALVNYYRLMEQEGKVASEPRPAAPAAGGTD
jgi:cytochrome c553